MARKDSAAVVPDVIDGPPPGGGSAGASLVSLPNSARAEVLALFSVASRVQTSAVRVQIYGEELLRTDPTGVSPEEMTRRILAVIVDDAREHRSATERHTYAVTLHRDESELFKATVRLRGGRRDPEIGIGGVPQSSIDASPNGIVRLLMKHLHDTQQMSLGMQGTVIQTMRGELERQARRIGELEAENAKLRTELRTIEHEGRADTLRAETERERQRMIHHLGGQLIKVLPHILRKWFGDLPADALSAIVPSGIARALASVTDDQIAALRSHLSDAMMRVIERARAGESVSVEDVAAFADLTDAGQAACLATLRPDQLEPIIAAVERHQAATPKTADAG